MSAFLSRYLDSLTGASRPPSSPGWEREGYSFRERYWSSLTRTPLVTRSSQAKPGPIYFEAQTEAAEFSLAVGPGRVGKHEVHHPSRASSLTRTRVAELIAVLLAVITASFAFAAQIISGAVYAVTAIILYAAVAVIFIRSFGLLRHSMASMGIIGAVISLSLAAIVTATDISSLSSIGGSHAVTAGPIPPVIPPSSGIFGSGKITSPTEGSLQDAGKILRVSGTVSHIPHGYHLALFVASYPNFDLYAADIDVIVKNKHWTGSIYLSQGAAEIVLAVLSPEGYKRLNGRGPTGTDLLESLVSSRDAAVLDHVLFFAY